MTKARALYRRFGFDYLDQPMGNTGHTSCGTWMAKDLSDHSDPLFKPN